MFSKLQAAIPLLKDEVHVDRWIKKLFPWRMNQKSSENSFLDDRECYQLEMENLPSLNGTFVTENGVFIDIKILNLSANGLSGRISTSEPLFKGQVLTILFVLPLEELEVIKTETRLLAINSGKPPDSKVVRLDFSASMEAGKKELIHRYIIKKQFEMIKQLRGWRTS